MRRIALLIIIAAITASCGDGGKSGKEAVSSKTGVREQAPTNGAGTELPGAMLSPAYCNRIIIG